jgi:hypothetical protein
MPQMWPARAGHFYFDFAISPAPRHAPSFQSDHSIGSHREFCSAHLAKAKKCSIFSYRLNSIQSLIARRNPETGGDEAIVISAVQEVNCV